MSRQVKGDRPELPTTCIIDCSIEDRFARIRARSGSGTRELLAIASDAQRQARARVLLTQSHGRAQAHLREAARRMPDFDLDVAWRAALRGDEAVTLARVLPHVHSRIKARKRKGSPWRVSGWLFKDAT